MSVELSDYDESWPARYTAEADQIRAALGAELRRIEHVGSTAVPGLVAKPVVDVALSVEDIAAVDLEALGYVRDADLTDGVSFRREGFHVRAYELEPDVFLDHLRIRDYLRSHPEDRDAYAEAKRRDAKGLYIGRLAEMLRRG